MGERGSIHLQRVFLYVEKNKIHTEAIIMQK